jgi:hypothetical protein
MRYRFATGVGHSADDDTDRKEYREQRTSQSAIRILRHGLDHVYLWETSAGMGGISVENRRNNR